MVHPFPPQAVCQRLEEPWAREMASKRTRVSNLENITTQMLWDNSSFGVSAFTVNEVESVTNDSEEGCL